MKETRKKLASGARLDAADGEALFASRDLHALGAIADAAKRRRHGERAYYIVNRHINYSNLCALACEVCAFGKRAGDEGVYERTIEQVAAQASQAQANGASEVHVTGSLHPTWRIDRYVDMVRAIRAAAPMVHVKAFTAAEVAHFAALSGVTVEDALRRLIDAGLGSMPGGGAEIFDSAVRARLFPGKIDGRQWLEVHATAHRLGLRTNATMLYGHVETPAQRVAHLLALRELQDQTGGFQAFVPLSFVPRKRGQAPISNDPYGQAEIGASPRFRERRDSPFGTAGLDDLRTVAVSRLLLDNFEHVKTFWVMHTLKLSQVALCFGADDIDGTVSRYEIVPGDCGGMVSVGELCRVIREAGLAPVQRDSLYRPIDRPA